MESFSLLTAFVNICVNETEDKGYEYIYLRVSGWFKEELKTSETNEPKSSETSIHTAKYETLDILNRHGSAF